MVNFAFINFVFDDALSFNIFKFIMHIFKYQENERSKYRVKYVLYVLRVYCTRFGIEHRKTDKPANVARCARIFRSSIHLRAIHDVL